MNISGWMTVNMMYAGTRLHRMRLRRMIVAESMTARRSLCPALDGTWATRAVPGSVTAVMGSPLSWAVLPDRSRGALAALTPRARRLLRLCGVPGQGEEHVV